MQLISTHWRRYGIVVNSKATKLFDFIKLNIIRKLACKVKYDSQINGGLIKNLRIRFSLN